VRERQSEASGILVEIREPHYGVQERKVRVRATDAAAIRGLIVFSRRGTGSR